MVEVFIAGIRFGKMNSKVNFVSKGIELVVSVSILLSLITLGSFVRVFHNEQDGADVLSGMLYQDATMRNVYTQYPELLLCDSTYNTNRYKMPLFVMIAIDGNNNVNVVGLFVTLNESTTSLRCILRSFQEGNPAWQRTRVILTDKDMAERTVFAELFPSASLQLCLFHTIRNFQREITTRKMNMSSTDREKALTLLRSMAIVPSVEQFEKLLKQLGDIENQSLQRYFNKCWEPIAMQWANCYKAQAPNFGEATTSRLEALNGILKREVTGASSFATLFRALRKVIRNARDDRRHEYMMAVTKHDIALAPSTEDEKMFYDKLTPYRYKAIVMILVCL